MKRRTFFLAALLVGAASISPSGAAIAHSLETLQQDLFDKEEYFQIKGEPAPEFVLENAAGDFLSLPDQRGKVVVLHFIYAGCPDVCPLHAEKIADIQEMVNVTPMKERVEFLTVTTDPARDGPDVLEGYGQAHGLDPVNWTFLSSGPSKPEDTTRKLAEQFGHSFIKTDDGYQTHSVVTHVIDQNGEWVANFHGLGFEPTNLVMFINGLTNANVPHHEPDPSLWERVRSFF